MKLKSLVLALVLAATPVAVAGCNSAWWQNIQNNPVAAVDAFEKDVNIGLSIAAISWNSIKVYLPADQAVKAQLRYDQAVFAVNKSLALLNDGVQAAVDAKNPNPDFTKLIADVSDALAQVIAIIDEFKASAPTPAPSALALPARGEPTGYLELKAVYAHVAQRAKK